MGLDIYVGTFHRYYAGQWDTVIQQMAHGSGLEVKILRPQPGFVDRLRSWFLPKRDPVKEIERWKRNLSAVAGVPLDWNEHPEAEYFTDKPGWECFGALLLWAACEERGADRPETAEGWERNELLTDAMRDPSSKYRHLLGNTEIWLPVDFAEPFEAEAPDGSPKLFGSVQRLASELASLNGSTWRVEEPEISEWRRDAPEPEGPLDESARFGFALFSELAALALQHRLPMKLDY